jgi:hypothetical protein
VVDNCSVGSIDCGANSFVERVTERRMTRRRWLEFVVGVEWLQVGEQRSAKVRYLVSASGHTLLTLKWGSERKIMRLAESAFPTIM